MTTTQTLILVVVLVVLLAVAAGAAYQYRSMALRRKFGPEYDRVAGEQPSRAATERELRERERRHRELQLKELSERSQEWYTQQWQQIQKHFIDAPGEALAAADELVAKLITERGYPADDDYEREALLSVEHASALNDYRAAHEVLEHQGEGRPDTEKMRLAIMHYRVLVADLLGRDPVDQDTPVENRSEAKHRATETR